MEENMTSGFSTLHGVVRGRMIELDFSLSLPEGTGIRLIIAKIDEPDSPPTQRLPGFGALAEFAAELDEFDVWYRQQRHQEQVPGDAD